MSWVAICTKDMFAIATPVILQTDQIVSIGPPDTMVDPLLATSKGTAMICCSGGHQYYIESPVSEVVKYLVDMARRDPRAAAVDYAKIIENTKKEPADASA